MKIRFQADNDLNYAIVQAVLRLEPLIDFQTSQAARLHGVPDPEVLAKAAAEKRVLVSHDLKTMPRHFAEFLQTSTSAGVLLAPQSLAHGKVVEDLLLLWMVDEAEDWVNRIRILPL
jgi:Domain of unknown function (DUF5615)